MPYTKQAWTDGKTVIDATRMNNIENGIKAADDLAADNASKATVLTGRVSTAEGNITSVGSRASALETKVTALQADTGWISTGIVWASGWREAQFGAWSPLRVRRVNGMVHVNGTVQKTSGFGSGELAFTLPTGWRPSRYWNFPRGAVDPMGRVLTPESGPGGGITGLVLSFPID